MCIIKLAITNQANGFVCVEFQSVNLNVDDFLVEARVRSTLKIRVKEENEKLKDLKND